MMSGAGAGRLSGTPSSSSDKSCRTAKAGRGAMHTGKQSHMRPRRSPAQARSASYCTAWAWGVGSLPYTAAPTLASRVQLIEVIGLQHCRLDFFNAVLHGLRHNLPRYHGHVPTPIPQKKTTRSNRHMRVKRTSDRVCGEGSLPHGNTTRRAPCEPRAQGRAAALAESAATYLEPQFRCGVHRPVPHHALVHKHRRGRHGWHRKPGPHKHEWVERTADCTTPSRTGPTRRTTGCNTHHHTGTHVSVEGMASTGALGDPGEGDSSRGSWCSMRSTAAITSRATAFSAAWRDIDHSISASNATDTGIIGV
jgi:hypothetical protein